ncbi:MAG: zinc ribbon domain-containing protein [Gemmatimonadetes bacterium]|nr:zinc ribbon domain-containing protein [Gemmatimonadota bacterium]
MKCPSCRTESSGAYCAHCGAPLRGARCTQCNTELLPGARYCTRCGAAVRAAPSRLPWVIAGAALVALTIALLLPALRSDPAEDGRGLATPSGPASPTPLPGAAPPLTGTPREQADRLFNRIMRAREAGDSAQVAFFLPMAIAAYRQAGELDDDAHYHLSELELTAGDAAAALATAQRILSGYPQHLLGLAAAAQAAGAAGDREAARRYHQQLLAAYDAEISRPRPEYREHAAILPSYRTAAERFLGR